MALIAPPSVIEAPPRAPLPHGLFTHATPLGDPGIPWQQGVEWRDSACGLLPVVIVPDCAAPTGLPKDFTNGAPDPGYGKAFTVYGEFKCSPVGYTNGEDEAMATTRLLSREEQAVTDRIADFLMEAGGDLEGTDLTVPTTAEAAVPALEQHLAREYGSQGLLVLSLDALYALDTDSVFRTSTGLFTRAETPIVINRTNRGDDFDLGIIPMPVIYRSDVFTSSGRPGDLLDQNNNDLFAVAERMYVMGWTACGGAYVTL